VDRATSVGPRDVLPCLGARGVGDWSADAEESAVQTFGAKPDQAKPSPSVPSPGQGAEAAQKGDHGSSHLVGRWDDDDIDGRTSSSDRGDGNIFDLDGSALCAASHTQQLHWRGRIKAENNAEHGMGSDGFAASS